jgi:hypothetical protein
MKKRLFLPIMILLLGIVACNKDEETFFPQELNTLHADLGASFDTLNNDLANSVIHLISNINDSAAIRAEMQALFSRATFVVEFSYVTPQGIMKIIEPPLFYPTEGTNISQQNHIIKTFETKLPVLSSTFYAVEEFHAAVDIHPIVNNGEVLGGVTALFLPETILSRLINPVVKNQVFEIWVMEKGGRTIYDQDTDEIGRNIFTDPLYADFPELIAAAEKIDAEESGETSYSFYQTGTTNKVVKKTYWVTYKLYGMEWKLIWVKPE